MRHTTKKDSFISGNEMLATIDQQLNYGPRYLGAPGHERVQKFLIAEMKEQTNEVVIQSWNHKGSDGHNYKLFNIIGRLNPSKSRRIILATHYDSKRLADKDLLNKDQPVPGANDSASGVAVLVELARVLNDSDIKLNFGLDIVFFDGEEGDVNQNGDYNNWEPLGSTYFAEHLNEVYGKSRPAQAIVLDMVCAKNLKIYKEESSVQNAKSLVDSFWNTAKKVNNRVFQDKIGQNIKDDHTPLNQAGIPSILLIDFKYPPHHTTSDTLDKCSSKSLDVIARTVFEYVNSYDYEPHP